MIPPTSFPRGHENPLSAPPRTCTDPPRRNHEGSARWHNVQVPAIGDPRSLSSEVSELAARSRAVHPLDFFCRTTLELNVLVFVTACAVSLGIGWVCVSGRHAPNSSNIVVFLFGHHLAERKVHKRLSPKISFFFSMPFFSPHSVVSVCAQKQCRSHSSGHL